MRNHNITIEQYDEMHKKQKGRCAICGVHQTELKFALHVDHDHETNIKRSLLCKKCNTALGMFNDSIEILINAINYLKKWKY